MGVNCLPAVWSQTEETGGQVWAHPYHINTPQDPPKNWLES